MLDLESAIRLFHTEEVYLDKFIKAGVEVFNNEDNKEIRE